jgi:hypothetical protein
MTQYTFSKILLFLTNITTVFINIAAKFYGLNTTNEKDGSVYGNTDHTEHYITFMIMLVICIREGSGVQ